MPPRYKFKKEQIIDAAIAIIRARGTAALTARSLAESLAASPKVIFGSFDNMDDLKNKVYLTLKEEFARKTIEALNNDDIPSYITAPMVYIDYALEDRFIFEYLFIIHDLPHNEKYLEFTYKTIASKSGISYQEAKEVHFKYFIFVHGLTELLAKGQIKLSRDTIIKMLEENYKNLIKEYKEKEK